MNILNICFVCTKFDTSGERPWLTNELVGSLEHQGHKIDVLYTDWSCTQKDNIIKISDNVNLYVCSKSNYSSFGRFGKLLKWLSCSYRAGKMATRLHKKENYDLVISFSPSVTDMFCVDRLVDKHKVKSFHILWDFFPIHHHQIGMFSNKVILKLSKYLENRMLSKHDAVGLMSEKNIDFYRNNYPLINEQRLLRIPVWGDQYEPKKSPFIDSLIEENFKYAIFGGQITKGRGVEYILEVAKNTSVDYIKYIIIGSGSDFDLISHQAEKLDNVLVLPPVARDEYLYLVSKCHLGLIVTDPIVSVPTFPSKCIDYFTSMIPIACHVEKSTDFGRIIQDEAAAGLASYGDDIDGFLDNILTLISSDESAQEMGKRGYSYYERNLTSGKIAELIYTNVGE